ncbi:MAG: MBL fold metallo-hydrolase [Dehalococcoidia bacterium]|nr:MBL fold metallo-hydrolase [Dehalococcoidia bacterium]
MTIKLTFLGAAQNVTGSRYLVEVDKTQILVDCGLYQERELNGRNWDPFPIPPNSLDAVLLTHAHLDHCGLLPKLVREGFRGPIYCTKATSEVTQITLLDSAHIQQEDAEFKRKRHQREGRKGPYPEIPLYNTRDATACFRLFSPVRYEKPIRINKNIEATFYDAGHVLGSSMIKLAIDDGENSRTILFSGDVGRWDRPMLHPPTLFGEADYILVESTYGDSLHENSNDISTHLREVINSTVRAGGNVVIPSFAFERAQDVLYYLNKLLMEKQIPHLKVFVDSPMAVKITEVFEHHTELFDEDMVKLIRQRKSPFEFPGLTMSSTVEESKAINNMTGSNVIIAGSGMCNAGRIKHHLTRNIARPESTVIFVGYQAAGTLGRQIVDGAKEVRILGQMYPVKAKIVQMTGFSAHADRDELFKWLSGLRKPPKHVFVVHGETQTAFRFVDFLKERLDWQISAPKYKDEVVLE